MTSYQPIDDSFQMEKDLIKKPVGEFLNELSNKVKRSNSVKKQYTLEEIQREYGFPPKGSSPLKTREFLIESSSLSPPKLSNESFLRDLQKRTILQPVKILPSPAQQYEFAFKSNQTSLQAPLTAYISYDGNKNIQKQEKVQDYPRDMTKKPNSDEQSASKNEIKISTNKETTQISELQNQSQTQNKDNIPILNKIEINQNESLNNDNPEEEVIVLSPVRRNNHLKSILKTLSNSPIRQKSLITEFPDRQMPQRSSSLTSDIKLTLATSNQQQSQGVINAARILNIQPIEQQNDSNIEKQTDQSNPRENLRAAVQDPESQLQKHKPILMRSQSLNGLKRVHFQTVQEEPRVVPNNVRPLVDSAIFAVSSEVQEQKKQQQQQQQQKQAQQVPQLQQIVPPPLVHQDLRFSVPNLSSQGIQNLNISTKQNEFGKFYSAFKQNLVRSRESSPSSVSPLPRRPNQNMAYSTLSPVNTKRCKTSPSTSPVLLSLSPLKADKGQFQTKDFSLRNVLNLLPADTQLPQNDQTISADSTVNQIVQQQNGNNINQNISITQNKVLNESPFLKSISQNSSHKQDMKLKYKYDNSNYITHGQYYTPCYNIAPYQSHIKKNKDSNRMQNNSELVELSSTKFREQLIRSSSSRDQSLIQINKVRINDQRGQVNQSLQEDYKLEALENDTREKEKISEQQDIVEGEDKEEEDSEEITKDCCEEDDEIDNKQNEEKQVQFIQDEKIQQGSKPKETEDGVNNEKKEPVPVASQSPLLEIFKDQVISKRARVYFKRQDTNPVDSDEVVAARAVADRVIRSNSMK